MKQRIFIILSWILISSCIGAGTHGSIEAYQYPVKKSELQKVAHYIIVANSSIKQDTLNDYYNNDSVYITMQISESGISNSYTIRFYDWKQGADSAENSSISIAYAFNKNNEGGSEGDGGVKWYNPALKKELMEPFERQFINKIDQQLGVKHKIAD